MRSRPSVSRPAPCNTASRRSATSAPASRKSSPFRANPAWPRPHAACWNCCRRSTRAMRWPDSNRSAMYGCCSSSIRRWKAHHVSRCDRRAWAAIAWSACSPPARRIAPTESVNRWSGWTASKRIGCSSPASTCWMARRCWTSSPMCPTPMPCRMRATTWLRTRRH